MGKGLNYNSFWGFVVQNSQRISASRRVASGKLKMDQIRRVNNEYEGYAYDPKQRPPPQKYQERPRVEPEDGGEVNRNV